MAAPVESKHVIAQRLQARPAGALAIEGGLKVLCGYLNKLGVHALAHGAGRELLKSNKLRA